MLGIPDPTTFPTIRDLIANDVLWIALVANIIAQFSKPFTYWWRTKHFDWHHIAETGGMPSSHSAMVSALATGLAIEQGLNSPHFAIAAIVAMIVTYDAGGVRRQAGEHARAINALIAEVLSGQPIEEQRLNELLGHSRREVMAGVFFGIVVMALWKFLIQPLLAG